MWGFLVFLQIMRLYTRVQKKTFLEKQQVKKKEIVVESLLSCPPLIGGQVGKRFFGDHKSGTSSATFSVVVLQSLKKILKYRYLIWGVF